MKGETRVRDISGNWEKDIESYSWLRCIECGKSEDLSLALKAALHREVRLRTGWEIITHRIEIFGVCPMCNRERSGEG